ncbi:MAG TPA: EpsG family protein [Candidatus Limosilactobacillus merdigallinarum]|uniref:EpsG family protein n=1 Tax=Candidatus Limosilactobacillus merdigallinarum TaxID=2838652 RepID=A0A9D2AKP7_9LACO|nr:EpsG family protein [Candidatus Limosilactobacillus merdigallinarum]
MSIYICLFVLNIVTIPVYIVKPKLYLFMNLIPLWTVMAFRGIRVGADTITYSQIFYQSNTTQIPMNFFNWFAPVNGARFENGFLLLNKIIYSIYPSFRLMLVVTTTIMILCLTFFILRLNINYVVGILVYESMFMPFSMNVMRQALAISLCMVAFVFLIKNHVGKFLIFNYLAITMHVTAWMFLIVLIYKYLKYGWKSKIFLGLFTIIVSLFFETIYGKISLVSNEANSFSNSVATNNMNGSLNIFVSIVLILLTFLWSRYYTKLYKVNDNVLINDSYLMLLTAIAFYIIALKFSQLSRIAIYFNIGYYPILSLLSGYTYSRKRILAFSTICMFLIVYFVVIQIFRPEWSNIVPYSIGGII